MTTFLLIRHGITDITGELLTGRSPGYHLNEPGRAQARALAERLEPSRISAIYSSPIERARETAAPLASRLGIEVRVSEAFTELDFGAWSGKTFAELESTPEWKTFNHFRSTARPPGGESILDIQYRTIPELDRLHRQHANEVVAIFTHGDPIRAVLLHYLGMPGDFLHRLDIWPASVTKVELQDWGPRVIYINAHG